MIELAGFSLTSTARGKEPGPDAEWVPAVVPGGVHESLLAAGLIEHPYFGDNEHSVAWVEDRWWWYRASFAGPEVAEGERVVLSLEGVDTVARVWLNGVEVGGHRNQHRPFRCDVTARLMADNELLVRFDPPLDDVLSPDETEQALVSARARAARIRPGADEQPDELMLLPARRTRRRKAAFSWGWDFAPRVPSLGLIGPVVLRTARVAELLAVGFLTTSLDVDAATATVRVRVEVDCFGATPDEVVIRLAGPGVDVEVRRPGAALLEEELELSGVRPWWTHDLGEQPLYDLTVELHHAGEVVDSQTRRVGIRTVELDRSADPDEQARLFRFLLNGVPVFARGANWVPASMLVGSVPEGRHRGLVRLARDGGMTMLRVWGGGIYEPAAFFDACDDLGVLVWQDFMFACSDYPSDDPDLVRETELEAAHQVRRLGHHACLALWCGENEVQTIHELTVGNADPGPWGWSLFNEVLPRVVEQHSPGALYWPGSPWAEVTTEILNGVTDGDRHAWEVWHGIDLGAGGPTEFATRGEAVHFHRYAHDRGRFISEFGIHASPELGTLERWTPPGSLALRSPAFDQRNKDTPKDKGFALMERETGIPTTLGDYVDFSMACQAEGLKFGVEHYRRRQPHCSGTLVWQLNDPWPGFSWSVIDHDLVPKAGYWFLQRAYQPVLTSFRATEDGLELWLTNSTPHQVRVDLLVELASWTSGAGSGVPVSAVVEAHGSEPVWSSTGAPGPDLLAWVSSPGGEVAANRAFFAPLKELPLGGAVVAEGTRTADGAARVVLRADGFGYLCRLSSSDPRTRYDANYLDLRAGEERVVTVTGLSEGAELTVASYGRPAAPVSW